MPVYAYIYVQERATRVETGEAESKEWDPMTRQATKQTLPLCQAMLPNGQLRLIRLATLQSCRAQITMYIITTIIIA